MKELRIIGGKARGRRIRSVPGETTRPITDKVKEALFNILGFDIQDTVVLDLFAGTGSVGIEALSRGAKFVYFIDSNWLAIKTIRENLKTTGYQTSAEVIHTDALTFLEKPAKQKFEYIYVAPPQYKKIWSKALLALSNNLEWLSDDGWVIVQIHPIEYESILDEYKINNLTEFDQRLYGSTKLVFYRKTEIIST